MAIAIENASIGTPLNASTGSTTGTLTTNVTVASGAIVVVAIFGHQTISSVSDNSGNGYTWAVDKTATQGGSTTNVAIASVYATSGLASGTVITVTYGSSSNIRIMKGISFTGGASSLRLDQSVSNTAFGSGTAWTTGSVTPTVSDSIVFGAYADFGTTGPLTSTPTAGWTEWMDENNADSAITSVYQIVANTSARQPGGTYSASTVGDQAGVAVNYKAGAGGTDATVTAAVSTATAAVVAPPLPRPTPPFTEINVRM